MKNYTTDKLIQISKIDIQKLFSFIPTKTEKVVYEYAGITSTTIQNWKTGKVDYIEREALERFISAINHRQINIEGTFFKTNIVGKRLTLKDFLI